MQRIRWPKMSSKSPKNGVPNIVMKLMMEMMLPAFVSEYPDAV